LKEAWWTTYDIHGHGTFGAKNTMAIDLKLSYTTFGAKNSPTKLILRKRLLAAMVGNLKAHPPKAQGHVLFFFM